MRAERLPAARLRRRRRAASTSAAAPSLIDDALPAVTVPSFWNAGRSAGQLLDVAAPGLLVVGDDRGRPLALRDLDRDDLGA